MPRGPQGVAPQGGAPAKATGSKKGLIIGVAAVLLLGGAAVAAWLVWGSSSLGGAASTEVPPVCQQALKCCKQVIGAQDPAKVSLCDNLSRLPEKMCTQYGEKYSTTAKALGLPCQ